MEEKVTKYLVDLGELNLTAEENTSITLLMKVESEFEKIGDYSYRISKNIEHMHDKEIKLSKKAIEEVNLMYMITMQTIDKTVKLFKSKNEDYIVEIAALKEIADVKNENYRQDHIDRLKKGTCNVESGIIFLEFLTVFEKIFDHCLHVSMELSNFLKKENIMTKQGYYKRIYEENTKLLKDKLNEYSIMYDI
jgi:phosphate:Na+ symporter